VAGLENTSNTTSKGITGTLTQGKPERRESIIKYFDDDEISWTHSPPPNLCLGSIEHAPWQIAPCLIEGDGQRTGEHQTDSGSC